MIFRHKYIIIYLIYLSLILYLIGLFNIYKYAPKYLLIVETILKILIGLILVICYNPIYTVKIQSIKIERSMLFTAGVFILLSTSFFQYFKMQLEQQITGLTL